MLKEQVGDWEPHEKAWPERAFERPFHPTCFGTLEQFVSMFHYVLILVVKILAEFFFFLMVQIVVLVVFLVIVNFFSRFAVCKLGSFSVENGQM